MRLRVRLFAVLRERAGAEEVELDGLPEELDLRALKREIAARFPALGDLGHVAGVVDERYVPDDTSLSATSRVALLPPVSGGAGSGGSPGDFDPLEQGVFEISADALDVGALGRRLRHPDCGAVVVFTGSTRATNREREVRRLDYQAFEEMAGPEMGRIFAECRARHAADAGLLRMLCAHRVGTVEVGEASVVVAAASPHREHAFAAARFLIDTLKERLPVWKREDYADGHHWIGDRS
jgi:molybdopterin synthase catalytic subunit